MKKIIDIVLIIGFLAVDFFFFHDILKPGEVITLPQYLTGLLSLLVFVVSVQSLMKSQQANPAKTDTTGAIGSSY